MNLPQARGSLSAELFTALTRLGPDDTLPALLPPDDEDDAQVALWVLYELHYRGIAGVPDELEWHPDLLRVRRELERDLERELRARWAAVTVPPDGGVATRIFALVEAHDGPSLATHVQRHADEKQVLELLRVRSLYHLKETDPTTWSVPRLPRASQAALVEVMYDEYGAGRPEAVHSELFARAMRSVDLDDAYGTYVDVAPAEVLAQNNVMSFLGLHRRLRAASVGHLAAFEATSSLPSRRLAQGIERLGLPQEVAAYYLEHVEADAVHEQLAARGICAALVEQDPAAEDDVLLGAFTCLDQESRVATALLTRWGAAS